MVGRRIMGHSLLLTGDIAQGRAYLDQAIALYDPAEHRPLATRFGQDVGVTILSYRSWALWFLGYPDAALRDANEVLKDAREIGHAPTLMYALTMHRGPKSSAGTTRRQTWTPMNLPLWLTKRAPCSGRRSEWWTKVGYWP